MWDQLLEFAANNGIWALLFVGLFIYQIKDSKTREESYQTTINSLADKLEVVNEIKEAIDDISETIKKPE